MQDKTFFVLLLASGSLFLATGNHTNRQKVSLATTYYCRQVFWLVSMASENNRIQPIPGRSRTPWNWILFPFWSKRFRQAISTVIYGKLTLLESVGKQCTSRVHTRHLTSVPHVAGTKQDLEQATWIRDRFLEFGLDKAQVVPYQVLLSYPDATTPNRVYLLDEQGQAIFTTSGRQTPLYSPEEYSPDVLLNFNAYSATGLVEVRYFSFQFMSCFVYLILMFQGNLVYAHYGREEDFEVLRSRGIDVTGKIVLLRYGAVFRGSKVFNLLRLMTTPTEHFCLRWSWHKIWAPSESSCSQIRPIALLKAGILLTPTAGGCRAWLSKVDRFTSLTAIHWLHYTRR